MALSVASIPRVPVVVGGSSGGGEVTEGQKVLSLGASFPAPVPPPSHAPATASQCTVEVYTR
ncbi:hypothetical protein BT67DRAFT_442113, partial [Trichocladium antarcticum]